MLRDFASSAILGVTDLKRARQFYGDTLGLQLINESMGTLIFKTGGTQLVVYPSKEAGTNRANAVVWGCGDELETIVDGLIKKGVKFEHYPEMDAEFVNGVHRMGTFGAAWCKDPDGNILHLNSGR